MPEKKNSGSRTPSALLNVAGHFALRGTMVSIQPWGAGHIHETYRVRTNEKGSPGYILQRINHNVFKNIPDMMENIVRVTGHLRKKIAALANTDLGHEVLTMVPTLGGGYLYRDDSGNYWRCYIYIEHQPSEDRVESPDRARETGKLFGRFIDLLADLPGPPLIETIPRFHDVEFRLGEFEKALQADPLRRKDAVAAEIAFVLGRAEEMQLILRLGRAGRIPLRVTHNDTKFNNILFDKEGRGLCVIDLDTVMPGYVHYDFGDAVRSGANRAREDEPDLEKVGMDIDRFTGFARGFLGSLHQRMNGEEITHLAFSAKLFAYIVGVRFLNDYLDGDRYFKTSRPKHNLQRAKVHFKLLEDMDRQYARMQDIVLSLAEKTIS
jgi:hypothetical protein